MEPRIRSLTAEDASAFLALRLRALREHPEAFATSEAEELERSPDETLQRISPGPTQVTLGAFDQGELVGFAALVRSAKPKQRHRATLSAMYVVAGLRGHGLGQALLDHAIEIAVEWGVSDVALAVTVGNEAARTLYSGAGFVSYGVEPRSLVVERRFYDVELMNLKLQ